MSLFDVLKYPISKPVMVRELQAVPDEIYDAWYESNIQIYDSPGFYKSRAIVTLLLDGVREEDAMLADLRKRIREYDPG